MHMCAAQLAQVELRTHVHARWPTCGPVPLSPSSQAANCKVWGPLYFLLEGNNGFQRCWLFFIYIKVKDLRIQNKKRKNEEMLTAAVLTHGSLQEGIHIHPVQDR